MTTNPDILALQQRVAFLEEMLYGLGSLLTGKQDVSALPDPVNPPLTADDQSKALALAGEVLVATTVPNCPPWCKFGGGGGPTNRPANWPAGGGYKRKRGTPPPSKSPSRAPRRS